MEDVFRYYHFKFPDCGSRAAPGGVIDSGDRDLVLLFRVSVDTLKICCFYVQVLVMNHRGGKVQE